MLSKLVTCTDSVQPSLPPTQACMLALCLYLGIYVLHKALMFYHCTPNDSYSPVDETTCRTVSETSINWSYSTSTIYIYIYWRHPDRCTSSAVLTSTAFSLGTAYSYDYLSKSHLIFQRSYLSLTSSRSYGLWIWVPNQIAALDCTAV